MHEASYGIFLFDDRRSVSLSVAAYRFSCSGNFFTMHMYWIRPEGWVRVLPAVSRKEMCRRDVDPSIFPLETHISLVEWSARSYYYKNAHRRYCHLSRRKRKEAGASKNL